MTIPPQLAAGFSRFRADLYPRQKQLYEDLADKGQKPHTLVIGCSDSRVDPSQIFDASPGELFVVRNVANLVPPYETDGGYHGVSAALEFAVTVLKVSNILVLGHKQCGGVHACAGGHSESDSIFLGHWISALQPALAEVRKNLDAGADVDTHAEHLELNGIRHSIERLKTYPFVKSALDSSDLIIHGARFGVADGELEWMNDDGHFQPVPS
ncbi:carbonic anhydrase [Hyphobacterium sp.]|uniref:carbonic anhydrase n=1 Tax=Hyphobacterium sp. TaxID=2004662 RepID=UPI003B52B678